MNVNKNHFIIVIVAILAIAGLWYISVIFDNRKVSEAFSYETTEETSVIETETISEEKEEIKVYITGEVNKPGVYSAYEDDRICDIVEKAGGFTKKADSESANLAAYVTDEEHIIIKNIDDNANEDNNLTTSNKSKKLSKNNNNIIDINKASAEELKTLDGIGDALSEKIIEYRENNGPFKSIDELKNVSHIGDKLFSKIKDYVKVS